jgi:hypothetical protein
MPPPGDTWMPPQGSLWVLAPPGQYMQPPNMPDVQCGLQSTPESTVRTNRRHKRKGIDADTRKRTAAGKKPYQVRVKVGGEIDGGCAGKNAWDSAVRSAIPRTLDMSILSWEGQSTNAIDELQERLDCDFEYVGYSLSMQGFRSAMKKYMRQERSRLKTRYREGHKHCPLHIEEEQWTHLVNYWEANTTMEKSKKMLKARGPMKVLSIVRRRGKHRGEAEEVQISVSLHSCFCNFCVIYVHGGSGHMIISSILEVNQISLLIRLCWYLQSKRVR